MLFVLNSFSDGNLSNVVEYQKPSKRPEPIRRLILNFCTILVDPDYLHEIMYPHCIHRIPSMQIGHLEG